MIICTQSESWTALTVALDAIFFTWAHLISFDGLNLKNWAIFFYRCRVKVISCVPWKVSLLFILAFIWAFVFISSLIPLTIGAIRSQNVRDCNPLWASHTSFQDPQLDPSSKIWSSPSFWLLRCIDRNYWFNIASFFNSALRLSHPIILSSVLLIKVSPLKSLFISCVYFTFLCCTST